MVYKLMNIKDLDAVINEVLKYDSVTLYKSVRSQNGFYNKLRLGEYIMYDGDNCCEVLCEKSLVSSFKAIMSEKGYVLSKERRGRVR